MTNAAPHTVLVVEDEEDLREMIREALELSGYNVVTAEEGQEALRKLDHIEHLCVVLLDLLMPGMNGWEFFEKFRARPELMDVPVIVHSSTPSSAPAGATRVVQKPLLFDRLISVIGEYCKN
jgi:CheY-like chemotaxis protein